MKIARPQTIITRCSNDIINLLGDAVNYSNVSIDEIKCGDSSVLRASFMEGNYDDHLKCFKVCPYLSAYMLGYSKMLMQSSFQFLVEIGATPLYTDTDSIVFAATPEQWQSYSNRFISIQKTFGSMEQEKVCDKLTFKRLVAIAPKKYCCVQEDGSYEWHANGIRARLNTHLDILERFEKVLKGEIVDTEFFSITAGKDFKLKHTPKGTTKKLRFICLKAAVENDKMRWWKDEEEFRVHASTLVPLKNFDVGKARPLKEYEDIGQDLEKVFNEGAVPTTTMERQVIHRAVKTRVTKTHNPPASQQETFVYVLRSTDGVGDSYVGLTCNTKLRLRQHNREARGGARETLGRPWEYFAIYRGFNDRKEGLVFETLMKDHIVSDCEQRLDIANSIIESNPLFHTVERCI